MLTGDTLANLDDEALWHAAPKASLFAEIDPQQKERIVRALQRTGHSVGTTIAATVFTLAVPFFGSGSRLFGFVPLSTVEMGAVVGNVTAYLAATEATKRWFFCPRGPTPA